MEIVIKGIITGLFLSAFIGATFFMLIETSMTRGFRAALWFDLGVIVCDAIIIAAVYFFAASITKSLMHSHYFNLAGGLAFVGFGINYIIARRHEHTGYQAKTKVLKLFLNGFFINLLNPSVVIFWLGSMAVALSHFKFTGKQCLAYFATALGVVLLVDIAKAYFASKLSRFLRPGILRRIYVFSGILMIGLGIFIIFFR
jgi:threonine/homoserine/homoserine lactone efflux protein